LRGRRYFFDYNFSIPKFISGDWFKVNGQKGTVLVLRLRPESAGTWDNMPGMLYRAERLRGLYCFLQRASCLLLEPIGKKKRIVFSQMGVCIK